MPSAEAPSRPRFEHRAEAGPVLGIDTRTPRLSWSVPAADPDYTQREYQVETTRGHGPAEVVTVVSAEQVLVPWPAAPLSSRERVAVRVRVRCDADWSGWSEPAVVEAALFQPEDWTARFITPRSLGRLDAPAPILRGRLRLPAAEIRRARLHITAHGLYQAHLNGERVGDHLLAPGWTSYPHRLRYQTHDVTDLVRAGENTLDVLLGNGWYRGHLGFHGERARYGDRLALLAQLEVVTADGATHLLATDGGWTAGEGQVLADDLYDGQRTDLRRAATPVSATDPVDVLDSDLSRLVCPSGPPVRVTGRVPAVEVTTSPSGRLIVDFGQNLVGWVRLRTRGHSAGDEVVVRHAEVLDSGELATYLLRTARATDSYLLAGPEETVCEPSLTFHGFRYAEVSGVPELRAEDVEAVVIGSDLRRTGWFTSSHDLLNRFHQNVVWGMRGNFVDVPTDCPQRDERLGWTGDIQVFSPTAGFLFDTAGFLGSWLADLRAEQLPNGCVPYVIPNTLDDVDPAAAAWGDAAAVVPWVVYQRSGDLGLLARQLPSMRAWVDREAELAGDDHLWTGCFQFGDWLDPAAPPDNAFAARTHSDVVATACLARSAEIVANACGLVGDAEGQRRYADLAGRVRAAFAAEYMVPGGKTLGQTATGYAMALCWALLPTPAEREWAGRQLAGIVAADGYRIATGFVGTPLIAEALADAGEVEAAYRLLLQTECPSWLYPVTMGATTIWERWDSVLPDGQINSGRMMVSLNHYALGSVADWLHRRVAGLAPASAGYRDLLVSPVPGPGLDSAAARHLTPYGEAEVSWLRADGVFRLRVVVPVGSKATVCLPDGEQVRVGHGTHRWEVPDTPESPLWEW